MKKIRINLYAALVPYYCPGVDRVSEGHFEKFKDCKEKWAVKWFIKAHRVVRYAIINNFANGVQWCYSALAKSEKDAQECHQKIKDYCEINNFKVEVSDLKNDLQFCMHPQIQFIRYFEVVGLSLSDFKEMFISIISCCNQELLDNLIYEVI